jgi:hypothetical protein
MVEMRTKPSLLSAASTCSLDSFLDLILLIGFSFQVLLLVISR